MSYVVEVHHSFDDIDQRQLKSVLEQSLGGELDPTYFDVVDPKYVGVCKPQTVQQLEERGLTGTLDTYLGIVVVEEFKPPKGDEQCIDYLDKIGVHPSFQGNGVGRVLWELINRRSPRLFLRTRTDRPANGWYAQTMGQPIQEGEWNIYHRNIQPADLNDCIRYACAKPKTINGK